MVSASARKEILTPILGALVTYASRIKDSPDPIRWVMECASDILCKHGIELAPADLDNFADPSATIWLTPIFANIQTDTQTDAASSRSFRYAAGEFNLNKLFPEAKSPTDDASRLYSREILDAIAKAFEGIKTQDFFNLIGELDSIIFRFMWNVPVSKDEPDTSLYEATRLKVARISCHAQDKDTPYLLISGDLSGIQAYIREAAGHRSKGAAKRLRARSFRLQMLVMAFCDRFVRALELTPMNILSESGGNFLILAANDDRTKSALDAARRALQKFFYEETWLETSLSLAAVPMKESDFALGAFQKIQEGLQRELQTEKQRKFRELLTDPGRFLIGDELYHPENESQPFCRNCQKFHKLIPPRSSEKKYEDLCEKCSLDIELGEYLVDAQEIAIGPPGHASQLSFDLKDPLGPEWDFSSGIWLKTIPTDMPDLTRFRMVQGMRELLHGGFKFIANWVPRFTSKAEADEYDYYFRRQKEQNETDDTPNVGAIKSFGHLASYRPEGGVAYLGVLKADVDNLGLVMQSGLSKEGSAARVLGLSRMLEAFFSGWTRAFLASPENAAGFIPSDIYTVYSGGDDLLFAGRWDDLILFTAELRKYFGKLCCGNMTISSAVVVVSPNYPVSEAVSAVDDLLNREAKKFPGKNAFAVLGTVIPGDLVMSLMEFGKQIEDAKDDKGNPIMGSGMIHRFLGYHESALLCEANMGKPIKGFHARRLIYRSHVKYEIARNFYGRKKPDELPPDVKALTDRLVGVFFKSDDENQDLLTYLRFPLTWAAYRQRGGIKEKERDYGQTPV